MKLFHNLMHKILYRITDERPARWINDGKTCYLERYFLCERNGLIFYLHHFVGSDPDRGLHNHKWHAWSFVLCGWYWEERAWGQIKVRWFNRLNPDTMHRVLLPTVSEKEVIKNPISGTKLTTWKNHRKQSCWTLFVHRAENDVDNWGFKREIEGEPGAWYLEPYRYAREGNQERWWETAPKGKQLRAMKAGGSK